MPPVNPSSGSDLSELEEDEIEGDPTVLPESSSYLYVAGLLSRELLAAEPKKTPKTRICCLHPACTNKCTVSRKMTTMYLELSPSLHPKAPRDRTF
jgi:hypothetical protein